MVTIKPTVTLYREGPEGNVFVQLGSCQKAMTSNRLPVHHRASLRKKYEELKELVLASSSNDEAKQLMAEYCTITWEARRV